MENNFGKNLKRIRTNNNMKQDELAQKMKVKQVTISSWETGRSEPSMGDIARLSEILQCTQEELIGIKKTVGNISIEDILAKISELNIVELEKIDCAIKNRIQTLKEIQYLEVQRREHEEKIRRMEAELARLKGELK